MCGWEAGAEVPAERGSVSSGPSGRSFPDVVKAQGPWYLSVGLKCQACGRWFCYYYHTWILNYSLSEVSRITVWLVEPTPPTPVLQGSSGTREATLQGARAGVGDFKAAPRDLQGVRHCLLCERVGPRRFFISTIFEKRKQMVFLFLWDMERSNTLPPGCRSNFHK